jgi:hypothetical protein
MIYFVITKNIFRTLRSVSMKTLPLILIISIVVFGTSCHKCYECKQYCAYCQQVNNTGVVYKICASKDVTHGKIDSIYFAMKSNGYDCSLLDDEKRVCDRPAKLDDAVDYYQLQEYYCYPE